MSRNNTKINEEVISRLSEENRQLRENRLPREYTFVPVGLTSEEQEIIGRFADGPLLDLITKWFKFQADKNNDYLIHGAGSPEKHALWRTAVLMYDDWRSFIDNCRGIKNRNNKE